MYAVKDTAAGLYYTGKKNPDLKWSDARCEAKWMPKTTAKAVIGGLRNSRASIFQNLRVVSIEE